MFPVQSPMFMGIGLLLRPVFFGRQPCIRFEVSGEGRWVGEAELVADLLDVKVFAVAKQ